MKMSEKKSIAVTHNIHGRVNTDFLVFFNKDLSKN